MASTQAQRDFVALYQTYMADDKARAKLDAFLDKARASDLVDCITAYFDASRNYAISNGKSAGVFVCLVKAALRKSDVYIALRAEVLVARKDSEWNRHYQALDAKQREAVQAAIKVGKRKLSASQVRFLKQFADYMKGVNERTFTKYVEALAANPLRDCLMAYIEVSQAYADDSHDSVWIFWGMLSRVLGIIDGYFAAQVNANIHIAGSVWQRRYLALEPDQRKEIDRQIAAKARGMTADATAAARDEDAEAKKPRTKTQKEFLRLLAAAMQPADTRGKRLHALTDWLTALRNFRELSECIEAYIDAPAKLSNNGEVSVQIFFGLVWLAVGIGPSYFALKYEELIKVAGSVWQQRRAAMKADEITRLEIQIKDAKAKVRLLDLWRIAYYREHRRDADNRKLVAFAPALPDDAKKSLDGLISDADVAWGAPSYERMNKTIEQLGDLFKAQTDPVILVAMLHRIRDDPRLQQLLRDELYWCGLLHLNVCLMSKSPFTMQYKRGFDNEEIKLLLHGIGARNRYVTDFALRLQYATDKRSNRLEIGDLCKSHLILLMLARQWDMALVPMSEAKGIRDEVEAWRKRNETKPENIEIPVASRYDSQARVRVGETLGNLFVVWWHPKDGSVFLEMKDLERVLFEVDNYHRLGRIRDNDKTYGEIYRRTAHLLVLIPVFFEIMMYLPDLVSGGFTGLVKSVIINYAAEAVADRVGGGMATNVVVSTGLSVLTGRGPRSDADDVARGLATDAKAAARAGEAQAATMARAADDAAEHALARTAGTADRAATRAADDVGAQLLTPAPAVVTAPPARATLPAQKLLAAPPPQKLLAAPPAQKLLAAPHYAPSVLDTAVASGLQPDQVVAMTSVLGKDFATANMREFASLWQQARRARHADIERLQHLIASKASARAIRKQSRKIFGKVRDDFWDLVRNGSSQECKVVRDKLTQAGMYFHGRAKAPLVTMNTRRGASTTTQVQIDHRVELGQDPMKAFSADNFRLALRDENTILLNQLMMQDPFQPNARLTTGRGTSRAGRLLGDPNYKGRSPKRALLPDPNTAAATQAQLDEALDGMIQNIQPGDFF